MDVYSEEEYTERKDPKYDDFTTQTKQNFGSNTIRGTLDKNKENEPFVKIEIETDLDTNSFTDIEYSGFDLSGNRYLLKARQADFKTETPELINMKIVEAKFYLKDNTI